MTELSVPDRKPARPHFSSGPCAKPPGWSPEKIFTQSLGRSHRSKLGKTRLQYCIDLMREVLQVPDYISVRFYDLEPPAAEEPADAATTEGAETEATPPAPAALA